MRKSIGIYLTSMTMGGAERVALNLCSGLSEQGYEVDLILVNATGKLLEDVPSNVSIVNLNAGRVARSIVPLRDYLSSQRPDVLYSMMTEPNIIALLARTLTSVETKLVISEHNMLSQSSSSLKDQFVRFGAWALYPLADDIVAVSEGVKRDLVENTRLDTDAITLIHNPVDVESIQSRAKEPVDHEWFKDENTKVILSGGRHEPQKGFKTLLNGFARVERRNIRLMLFGAGPETERLKEQATTLGIDGRVWFPGFVENPYKYMENADVFVLSSQYEGFGLVLIEALACGCPVVSTDCESGPAEVLEEGKYGSLVPVGDDTALGEAVRQCLDNSVDSDILRHRSENFNIKSAIQEYMRIFEDT
jgi:glycosyltransferase involved in cell wall biosynthesis